MKRDVTEGLPPYPAEGVTAAVLYAAMLELWAWTQKMRSALNTKTELEAINILRGLNGGDFHKLPVADQFRMLQFIRRLRECWDHLVRQYEDDWDADHCVRQKLVLIQTTVDQLNDSCKPTGRDESFRRDMDRLQAAFKQLATSGHHEMGY